MATSKDFAAYAAEQFGRAGTITYKRMFGEYGLYCDGTFFAMACDNQLFVKDTPQGEALLGSIELAPPYPGATPWLLIADLEDSELLCELAIVTCTALHSQPHKK